MRNSPAFSGVGIFTSKCDGVDDSADYWKPSLGVNVGFDVITDSSEAA